MIAFVVLCSMTFECININVEMTVNIGTSVDHSLVSFVFFSRKLVAVLCDRSGVCCHIGFGLEANKFMLVRLALVSASGALVYCSFSIVST